MRLNKESKNRFLFWQIRKIFLDALTVRSHIFLLPFCNWRTWLYSSVLGLDSSWIVSKEVCNDGQQKHQIKLISSRTWTILLSLSVVMMSRKTMSAICFWLKKKLFERVMSIKPEIDRPNERTNEREKMKRKICDWQENISISINKFDQRF